MSPWIPRLSLDSRVCIGVALIAPPLHFIYLVFAVVTPILNSLIVIKHVVFCPTFGACADVALCHYGSGNGVA